MASAPPLPFVSVEEYLRTSYEPECEYVDGILIPKEMHKRTPALVQRLLTLMVEKVRVELDLDYYADLRLQTSPTRVRVPDFMVFEGPLREEVPQRAPLLTIEVLSDTETLSGLRGKFRDHLSFGVTVAIMIDPNDRSVMLQDASGMRSIEGRKLVQVHTKKGVLEFDFDALFAEIDRLNAS